MIPMINHYINGYNPYETSVLWLILMEPPMFNHYIVAITPMKTFLKPPVYLVTVKSCWFLQLGPGSVNPMVPLPC